MMYLDNIDELRFLFGARVKALRKEQQLTQEQLAVVVGCDRTLISRIEHGRSNVSLNKIAVIASGLDISLPSLFNGVGRLSTAAGNQEGDVEKGESPDS